MELSYFLTSNGAGCSREKIGSMQHIISEKVSQVKSKHQQHYVQSNHEDAFKDAPLVTI